MQANHTLVPELFIPKVCVQGLTGQRIHRYQVHSSIGRGSTARVYRAEYEGLRKFRMPVALKVAKRGYEQSLFNEAQTMASIDHPNVVSILDFFDTDEVTGYAMEYIHGPTLRQLLREEGRLPLSIALHLGLQLARALQSLDGATLRHPIVHGDIKPRNIIMTASGHLKLLDFGISRPHGRPEELLTYGTPAYMAPEQVSLTHLDQRTDVFSFGTVLFEMVTGERLFKGRDIAELMCQRLQVDQYLDLKKITFHVGERCPELAPLIHRCVRARPVERYADFRQIERTLVEVQRSLPVELSVKSWWADRAYRTR